MLYLNQLEYPDIKYPTNVKEPGCDLDVNGISKTLVAESAQLA